MDIVNRPVDLATRSAVRCLIPVSVDGMVASGSSMVLTWRIFLASRLSIIAPSILASSYRLAGLNSLSMRKPPSRIASISGVSPRTINAPVLARNTFSSPSRSAVPGATSFSTWYIPSLGNLISAIAITSKSSIQSLYGVVNMKQFYAIGSFAITARRQNSTGKTQFGRFLQALSDPGHRADFSCQADFAQSDQTLLHRAFAESGSNGEQHSQIHCRLGNLHSAHHLDICVMTVEMKSAPLFQYCQQQRQAVVVDAVG